MTWNSDASRRIGEFFNPQNGLLASRIEYQEAAPWIGNSGEAITFAEDGKTPVMKVKAISFNRKDVLHGLAVTYASDGKTIASRKHYAGGVLQGLEEIYEPVTGLLTKRVMWANGTESSSDFIKQTGAFQKGSNASACAERNFALCLFMDSKNSPTCTC